MKLTVLVVAIAAIACTPSTQAQTAKQGSSDTLFLVTKPSKTANKLWGETRAGQSVDEVQKSIVGVTPLPTPVYQPNGIVNLLGLDFLEIDGKPYKVNFGFKFDRLASVEVVSEAIANFREASDRRVSLINLLRQKYGKEESSDQVTGAPLQHLKTIWIAGDTKIEMLMLGGPSVGGRFFIHYTAGVAANAAKL